MTIGVGLVGTGGIGRRHRRAWGTLAASTKYADARLVATSGRSGTDTREVEGVRRHEDWHALVDDPDVLIVDICAPDALHHEMVAYAMDAGKHILCEKPLAIDPTALSVDARRSAFAACFVYRHLPAVAFAKKLIAEGGIGRVIDVRADYLQGWGLTGSQNVWRLGIGGAGVIGDLGTHLMDLASYLVPDLASGSVSAVAPGDPRLRGNWSLTTAGGLSARFAASRIAIGYGNHLRLEVFGEEGAVSVGTENPAEVVLTRAGSDTAKGIVRVEEGKDRTFLESWWSPGIDLGWNDQFVHQVADMVDLVLNRRQVDSATLDDGLRADAWAAEVLDSMNGTGA